MDRRERFNDYIVAMRAMMDGRLANVWTALPGVVVSYDAEKQTCTVQPTIQGQQQSPQGEWTNFTYAPCQMCPVIFGSGGGYTVTFPIAAGDEGLLVFSSRCIDAWWQSGGVQPQADLRMHDPSDGFFIPGARSQANKLENVKTDAVQVRSQDGHTYVEVGAQEITITPDNGTTQLKVAPGFVRVVGNLQISGAILSEAGAVYAGGLQTSGNIVAGYGTGDSVTLQGHKHTQGTDSHGDTEQPTNSPTAGT